MPYCRYCEEKVDKDAVSCPKCGESLVGRSTKLRKSQIQERIEEAKHRANMYIILATVLVTMGLLGGSILFVSSSLLGLFGVVLVCLGIGCTAEAARYECKAQSLGKQLRRRT